MWRVVGLALVASMCSCAGARGGTGWFRADLAPRTGSYAERFGAVDLIGATTDCEEIADEQRPVDHPVVVLVHGAGGEGVEMEEAVPELVAWPPASMYMMRWLPTERRDVIATRLAAGVTRLAWCLPAANIVVIAHSAGGVVAGFAANEMHIEDSGEPPRVTVLTVGAPLAGIFPRPAASDGSEQPQVILDLGTRIHGYPAAAPGVRVVHLRTLFPGDVTMTPIGTHLPNDPRVGVPGAPQVDLPAELNHPGALIYVVRALIGGRAAGWLSPRPAAGPSSASR